MMRLDIRPGLSTLLLSSLLCAAPTAAEVRLVIEGALDVVCADENGAKHPKRVQLSHPLTPDAAASSALVALQYQSGGTAVAKRVMAAVTLVNSDGSQVELGALSFGTDQQAGAGVQQEVVPANLASADSVDWDVRFKNLKRLEGHECVVVLAGVGPVADDEE